MLTASANGARPPTEALPAPTPEEEAAMQEMIFAKLEQDLFEASLCRCLGSIRFLDCLQSGHCRCDGGSNSHDGHDESGN